jgi:preprotein translocase subunit YajC
MTVTSFTSLSLLSTQGGANTMMMTLALLAMVYFFFMRPQQSRDKKINQMRANLEVGDEVITKGGIIGRVCSIREDTLVIETASDRTRIRIARWAVEERTDN